MCIAEPSQERVADVMDLVRHLEKTNKDEWSDKLDLLHMAVAGSLVDSRALDLAKFQDIRSVVPPLCAAC